MKNTHNQIMDLLINNNDLYGGQTYSSIEILEILDNIDTGIKHTVIKIGNKLSDVATWIMDKASRYTDISCWDIEKDMYDYIIDNDIFIIKTENNNYYIIQK